MIIEFKYEMNPDNNGVTIIGIKGVCPKELEIPSYIEIDNKKIKVTGVDFSSQVYQFSNEITCNTLLLPETVEDVSIWFNDYIQEVFLPNSITKIGPNSFSHCSNLKTVHMPSDLKVIDTFAFSDCKQLESIIIPSTVIEIGSSCFAGCSSLVSITIPEGVTEIGINTFENCSNLRDVITLNESVTFYPTSFMGCKSLKSFDNHLIEDGLLYNLEKTELYTYLGDYQSNGEVVVPASVCELGNGFSSEDITSVDLSQTQINFIPHDTFSNCVNLKKVILPSTIKTIDDRAFCDCYKLSEINFPDSIEHIGVACFKNSSLKEVNLPNRLREIPQTAFMNCKKLSKVSIPLSVKSINAFAFENCNAIKQVTISEGYKKQVTSIFQHHNNINFTFLAKSSNIPKYIRTGAYTYGRLRPCPYCGSDNVNTYSDGTAKCNNCGGDYTYQR